MFGQSHNEKFTRRNRIRSRHVHRHPSHRRSRIDPPTTPATNRSESNETEPQALRLSLPSEWLHHGQEVWSNEERLHDPYKILECRMNGTVVIQRENAMVQETYNIRKIVPYRGPSIKNQNHTSYYEDQVRIWSRSEKLSRWCRHEVFIINIVKYFEQV